MKDKKLLGDSDYDCNYCHGKNHLAKECILRRMREKKDKEDDKACYLRKIEDLRKKKNVDKAEPALMMQEDVDEF